MSAETRQYRVDREPAKSHLIEMNFLIIGTGGREHALARALSKSNQVSKIFAIPGSDGISEFAECQNISTQDHSAISNYCRANSIKCVVIGPEVPLAEGLSDHLREDTFLVFGPSQAAAQLESSKIISKEFMLRAKVPTARSWVVANVAEVEKAARETSAPYVLKADGLAAGKGVYICKTLADLRRAAHELFVDKLLGSAGDRALLEEFTPGYELSYLVLTNGRDYEALPLAQDHKRLRDADEGPNTGGMGTTAPMLVSADLDQKIHELVLDPTMREMQLQNLFYRGVLFVGLMITPQGPSVLEYNTRFGDPETQVILPLLDGDWGDVFLKVSEGILPKLKWHQNRFATCIVLAAENYPENPKKGVSIEGLMNGDGNQYFLHAGTRKSSTGAWLTNGGRVLNAIGIADSRASSRAMAYAFAKKIKSAGMQFRNDIGNTKN